MDSNAPNQPLLNHAPDLDYHAPPSDQHLQQHPFPPPIVELEQNNPPKQNNPYQNPHMMEHNFPQQSHGAAYYQPQIIIPIPDFLEGLPTSAEGRLPQRFYCVMCKKPQVSKVHHKMGTGSWICTLALFLVICPASILPCCCNGCQDAVHTCPDCRRQVGKDRFCGM